MQLRSSFEPLAWPAVVLGRPAELMAILRQLDASQWWSPEQLRASQFRQLRLLLDHAARQVPFYAARAAGALPAPGVELTEEAWARIPLLSRRDVQEAGDALNAREIPRTHGTIFDATSGGSTGIPVRVRKTGLADLFWTAIHLREEIWHRDDPRGALLRIRRTPRNFTPDQAAAALRPPGLLFPDYGPPSSELWETGPIRVLDDRIPIPEQAAVLRAMQPAYVTSFPANLRLLATHCRDAPQPTPRLSAIWTLSEVVDDSLRNLCRDVFGCRIVHNYSSAEAGYTALQCPEHEHFHVQCEAVHLEVLRPDGTACEAGEIGKVVVTSLHNYATPLIRYEIGDEAEVGPPCPCGRGLPVLRRIIGRSYDYLTLPDGRKRRVDSGFYGISRIPAVREFQVVQRSRDRIELLLVLARPLAEAEMTAIRAAMAIDFGPEFRVDITPRDSIPRTEAGKLRIFVSELPVEA